MTSPELYLHPPHLGGVVWARNAMQDVCHSSGSEPMVIMERQEAANIFLNTGNLFVADAFHQISRPLYLW